MVKLDKSAQNHKPHAALVLNSIVQKKREQGIDVIHMGFGSSVLPAFEKFQNALKRNTHQNHYLSTQGLLALREQVAKFYEEMFKVKVGENH